MSAQSLAIKSAHDSPDLSSESQSAPSYRVVATPSLRVVTKGAKVKYRLECRDESVARPVYCEWRVIYDPRDRSFFELNHESWVGGTERPITWQDGGSHRVICKIHLHDCDTHYIVEYVQEVCELSEAFYAGPVRPLNGEDPVAALDAVTRELIVIRGIAKKQPPTGKVLERHNQQISTKEAFRDRLEKRLQPTRGLDRHIVLAEHIEAETQTRSPLRLFLYEAERGRKWRLIDWTSPTVQQWTGEYEGEGHDAKSALQDALKDWDKNNRYPAGRVRYKVEIPAVGIDVGVIHGEFETDGRSFWDRVSNVLNGVAIGSTVVAGVVTLLAPIPGSQLLSAAIWASLFTSTTSAVINIADRHAEGFGSVRADAFDILTIVGNMFAGANVATSLWQRGANLTFRTTTGVMRTTLIGQITTDSVQGVLVGVECVEQIAHIRDDESITPSEKVEKIAEVLRSAALTGILYYVNVKGTAKDLHALKQATAAETEVFNAKLRELKDPKAEVEVAINPSAKETPEVQGHTEQKTHTTVIQTEPDLAQPHVVKLPLELPPSFIARFKASIGEAHFDTLMAKVPALRKRLGTVANDLSDYEIAAVHAYTDSNLKKKEFNDYCDYQRLNGAHRSRDPFEIESYKEFTALLDSALAKLPAMSCDVFRGMDGVNIQRIREQFVPGKIWKDDAYMSTSHTRLRDSQEAPQVTMIFRRTKSGRPIESITAVDSERELLFPRGTKFKVLGLKEADGKFVVTLREVAANE